MHKFDKNKTVLEFDKIVQYIAGKCISIAGKEKIKNSVPFSDKYNLQTEFERITDVKEIILSFGRLPLTDFIDIRVFINRLIPENSYLKPDGWRLHLRAILFFRD